MRIITYPQMHLAKPLYAIAFSIVVILVSCTVKIPSDVIQPNEMKELLYDYHLMQALSGELSTAERYKAKLYEQYVFEKHGVTEAEFDSSLAWYMRNTIELEAIYKELNSRMTKEKEWYITQRTPNSEKEKITEAGDSVNIWRERRLYRLTTLPLVNRMKFVIPSDSNFHANDSLIWSLTTLFIGDSIRSQAIMSLSITLDNDSIVGRHKMITHNDRYNLSYANDSTRKIRDVSGYVYHYPKYYNVKDTVIPESRSDDSYTLIVSNIDLVRIHRKNDAQADTTLLEGTQE